MTWIAGGTGREAIAATSTGRVVASLLMPNLDDGESLATVVSTTVRSMQDASRQRSASMRTRDRDIRDVLLAQLGARHVNEPDTVVIEEFGVLHGQRRADVAVVNGELVGYEIKSDADTLTRLPGQVGPFSAVFDRVTIIVAPRHLERAVDEIPGWWGVVVASSESDRVELSTWRLGTTNLSHDLEVLARLFWRDEAIALLRRQGAGHDVETLRRRELLPLLGQIRVDTIRTELRQALKERTDWRGG